MNQVKYVDAKPEPEGSGIEVGRWQDWAKFCCKQCPFDSLYREMVGQHIVNVHSPLAQGKLRETTALLLDPTGRRITHVDADGNPISRK